MSSSNNTSNHNTSTTPAFIKFIIFVLLLGLPVGGFFLAPAEPVYAGALLATLGLIIALAISIGIRAAHKAYADGHPPKKEESDSAPHPHPVTLADRLANNQPYVSTALFWVVVVAGVGVLYYNYDREAFDWFMGSLPSLGMIVVFTAVFAFLWAKYRAIHTLIALVVIGVVLWWVLHACHSTNYQLQYFFKFGELPP